MIKTLIIDYYAVTCNIQRQTLFEEETTSNRLREVTRYTIIEMRNAYLIDGKSSYASGLLAPKMLRLKREDILPEPV